MPRNPISSAALIIGCIALAWLSGLTIYEILKQSNPNVINTKTLQCSLDVNGTPYRVYATVNDQTVVADEDSGSVPYSFRANKGDQIYIHGFGDNGMTITLTVDNQLIQTQSDTRPSIYYNIPW